MSEVTARKRPESNTWEYRFELARINGKRQQKSKGGFKTKKDALKAGIEAQRQYEDGGEYISPSEMSVSDLLDKWLAEWSKTTLKEGTAAGYAKRIRLYIKPVIGMYKAKSVTRAMLQNLITDLADQGFSKNTVSAVKGILTSCFNWAELNKIIAYSPANRLKTPRNTEVKQRTDQHIYLTEDMINNIFNRFPEGSVAHIPMMLAYHCGLRLGETYGLIWDDVDFEKRTLFIGRQVQWWQDKTRTQKEKILNNGTSKKGNGYWYFTSPKCNSFRTITLDEEIYELLLREKKRQEKASEYYDEHYVRYYTEESLTRLAETKETFSMVPILTQKAAYEIPFIIRRESGEYITPRTMQHTSRVIHTQLNCPDFDFHSFRHTHATKLLESGAPMIYIQNRLGHAKIETTEQVYTNHLTDVFVAIGDEALNNAFTHTAREDK